MLRCCYANNFLSRLRWIGHDSQTPDIRTIGQISERYFAHRPAGSCDFGPAQVAGRWGVFYC